MDQRTTQRMSGIDPMFIYSDTPETPMEIAYACVFDPSSAPGGYSFAKVRALLDERIPTLPSFRRRLVLVPLGLDHPRWVDDPDFDITNHLHRAAVPAPGGADEFTAKVAEVMGRPLTPGQPPWEFHIIEGLAGGRGGPDRQGAPLRDRRRGRGATARPAPRPQPRGPRRDRDVPALAAPSPALAGPPDDRLAAQHHQEPVPRAAGGPRGGQDGRAPGPPCARRGDGPDFDSAGCAGRLRDAGLRAAGGRVHRARYGAGPHAQGPVRLDRQRGRAGGVLGRAADASRGDRRRVRQPAHRRRARLGARPTSTRRPETTSRRCSSRSPTTCRRRSSACAR